MLEPLARQPAPSTSAREIASVAALFLVYFVVYFSPVLFDGRLLAVGDGVIYYLPALVSEAAIWNKDLYAGFPAFADPQALVFSPLRLAGGNYNLAVVAVYVLASTSAYCLVRHLTGSRIAGVLAGVVYGSGGAMIAHLGHLSIIYTAAWTPLIACAVSVTRDRPAPLAITVGAAAIGLSILGGHPQIFIYAMLVSSAYAFYIVMASDPRLRRPLLARYAVLFGAGSAIACIQLLPLLEAGTRSVREHFPFNEFVSYSLSPRELLLMFFPRILGGTDLPYYGPWILTELATYFGVATLVLTVAALTARGRERQQYFWIAVIVVGVCYALGPWTPLARVVYGVPGLNQFRAPARTAFVTTLAFAVLAGFGYRALVEHRLRGVRLHRMWRRAAVMFGLAGLFLYALYPLLQKLATDKGIPLPGLFRNPTLYEAFTAIILSAACIELVRRRPSVGTKAVLVAVLAIDLASFGWFYEWREGPPRSLLAVDKAWESFANDVSSSATRVLFLGGTDFIGKPAFPNVNLLYDLPSASGYGPMMLKDYAEAMRLNSVGASTSSEGLLRRLQIGGAAWLVGQGAAGRHLALGGDCTATIPPDRLFAAARFSMPVRATHLEIVSHMGCSTQVEQGAQIVRIGIYERDGDRSEQFIAAGTDTAEWAIDRADVAATIRHRRPRVAESFPSEGFNGHWFFTEIDVGSGGEPKHVDELAFDWLASPGPSLTFRSITLVNKQTGERHRVSGDDLVRGELAIEETRQLPGVQLASRIKGVDRVVWIVGETLPATQIQARDAIWQGRLPDGRPFDPYATALIDAANAKPASPRSGGSLKASAKVVQWENGLLRVEVESSEDAFLVISESAYPGWAATIDGEPTSLVRTNLAFQGLFVPAGKHTVVMSFVSLSLSLGFAAALLGVGVLIAYYFMAARRTHSTQVPVDAAPAPSDRW